MQKFCFGKQLGYQFHRQVPMLEYIVDFYCHELMLAIEIDGATHDNETVILHDKKRQKQLESCGVIFLRFTDNEVKHDPEKTAQAIQDWIKNNC